MQEQIIQEKKEVDNFKIKNCPHCLGTFEQSEIVDDTCPSCGEIIGSVQRKINIVDGELQEVFFDEVQEEMLKWQKKQNEIDMKREKKLSLNRSIHACKTREELEQLAEQKGYKPGWVHYRWNLLTKQREARARSRVWKI